MILSFIGGHFGSVSLIEDKEQFYGKGLQRDVKRWIRECVICHRFKSVNQLPAGFFNLCRFLIEHGSIFLWTSSQVCLNPTLDERNIIDIDRLTKYAHFIALAHPFSAAKVAQLFMNTVVRFHSWLEEIIHDRDRICHEYFLEWINAITWC